MGESLAAVNYSVPDRVNISDALAAVYAFAFRGSPSNDKITRRAYVSQRFSQSLFGALFSFKGNNCFTADALDRASSKAPIFIALDRVEIGRNQLKLDR